jgi:hypothetical protein
MKGEIGKKTLQILNKELKSWVEYFSIWGYFWLSFTLFLFSTSPFCVSENSISLILGVVLVWENSQLVYTFYSAKKDPIINFYLLRVKSCFFFGQEFIFNKINNKKYVPGPYCSYHVDSLYGDCKSNPVKSGLSALQKVCNFTQFKISAVK